MTALTLSGAVGGPSSKSSTNHRFISETSNSKSNKKYTNTNSSSSKFTNNSSNYKSMSNLANSINNNNKANRNVPLDTVLHTNPYLSDYIDCIENLPNKLQILLSQLRSVDVQVKTRHRKLQLIQQEIVSRMRNPQNEESRVHDIKEEPHHTIAYDNFSKNSDDLDSNSLKTLTIEQLLNKLHQTLMQCQCLGDQKMKLTSQVTETLNSKTKQLINWGCDSKTNEEKSLLIELDEKKIINDFKLAIKRNGNNSTSNGATTNSITNNSNGRTSTRFNQNALIISKSKQSLNPISKYNINGQRNNNNNSHLNTVALSTPTSATTSVLSNSNRTNNLDSLIDAYSFDDHSSNLVHASSPFNNTNNNKCYRNGINNDKLLRDSNVSNFNNNSNTSVNLLNSTKKKNNISKNTSDVNNNGLKRSIKKLKLETNVSSPNHNHIYLEQHQTVNSLESNSPSNDSLLTRSKRQLNYNSSSSSTSCNQQSSSKTSSVTIVVAQATASSPSSSLSNLNDDSKKQQRARLNQIKSSPTSSAVGNKSPSSSSTSSSTINKASPSKQHVSTIKHDVKLIAKKDKKIKRLNNSSNTKSGIVENDVNTLLNKSSNSKKKNLNGVNSKNKAINNKNVSNKHRSSLSLNSGAKKLRKNVDCLNDADDDDSENDENMLGGEGNYASFSQNSDDSQEENEDYDKEMKSTEGIHKEKNANNLLTEDINDRNSNETESINHIDDEEQTTTPNTNKSDQIDEENENDDEINESDSENVNEIDQDKLSKNLKHDLNENVQEIDDENDQEDDNDEDDEAEEGEIEIKRFKSKTRQVKLQSTSNHKNDVETKEPLENESTQNSNYHHHSKKEKHHLANNSSKSKPVQNSENIKVATASASPSNLNNIRSINADEPLYCTCHEISYGQMILCDNDACKIEWFHFGCVKLNTKPKGKWFCPECRGDTHKVMKKAHLINNSHNQSSPSSYFTNGNNSSIGNGLTSSSNQFTSRNK